MSKSSFRVALSMAWLGSSALVSPAMAQDLRWYVVNRNPAYELTTAGDAWSAQGATIALKRADGASDPWGGATAGFDAGKFVGKDVVLTGEISSTGGASNAAIWLRTDSPSPLGRSFQTTRQDTLHADQAPQSRRIHLYIPKDAKDVALGVLLYGPGEAHFTHLKLSEAVPASSVVDAPTLLDEAVGLIRGHALNAEHVDWDAFLKDARTHIQAGEPADAAYPLIQLAIARLADGHSFFRGRDAAEKAATLDGTQFPPVIKLLPSGVGYVELPGTSGPVSAKERYAESVAKAMEEIAPSVKHGWIVDLRRDSGGSVPPMLAALRALLGGKRLGAYRSPNKPDQPFFADHQLGFEARPTINLEGVPVAVILGPHTASAGEAAAVAFHGRAKTRSFGLPTWGQANANIALPLRDGSSVVLKDAIDIDRDGNAFGGAVIPDERSDDDATLDRAAWLTGQPPG